MFWFCWVYILSVSSAAFGVLEPFNANACGCSCRACLAALKQEGLYAWHSALPCFNRALQML